MSGHHFVKPEPGYPVGQNGGMDLASIPLAPASHVNIKPDPEADSPSAASSSRPQQKPPPEKSFLEQLVDETAPENLENGVRIGVQLLDSLKEPLEAALGAEDTQAGQWLKAIRDLQDEAKPTRTIVGVVGNTGAGKSSVINALLDEERLVPTNGMRACTASATEISYNHSDDPEQLYRAEIEFIAAADWANELTTLLDDLLDGSGQVSRDCTNPDTEAGLAYAKIKAVYPKKTREDIANSRPAYMAQEPAVRGVLGSTKRLNARNAANLFRGLQHYVDSKEKTPGQDVRMEYWPLIKVVRIYCKAPALSTGAVVVDLPGVHDSNAARAAVAESYMKACTGIWITAAIQRAVDDKTAKKLLGDSFKRQLKYDGTYSAVTFICTKTDDILESEVADSLNLDAEVGESWARIEDIRGQQRKLKRQISELKDEKYAVDNQIDELDAKADVWEELQSKLNDGETVYQPKDDGKKRKRKGRPVGSRKRRSSFDSDSEDDDNYASDDSEKENSQAKQEDENRIPLTEDKIDDELAAIRTQKKDLRKSKKTFDEKISGIKKQLAELNDEEETLTSQVKSVCIKGRNEYSRGAIKNDFAQGIKELDQEAAMDEDEENFDPDQDIRDYDRVAASLPVFCVSARAYQKLSGRLQKDAVHIDGFLDPEDTEIPRLQEHTKKLTEAGRIANCRRFLNELGQLLNSMKLWASSDSRMLPSRSQQRIDEMFVRAQLESLRTFLHRAVEDCIASFHETLGEQLYETFDRLIPTASAQAVGTATSWGAHRSLGGLFWATYKATVRRSGVYNGASGARDFNADLFDPISKTLAGPWERTFQNRLPSVLASFVRDTKKAMEKFHKDVTNGVQNPAGNPAGMNMLRQQIRSHITTLDNTPGPLREAITNKQRDASRGFTPVVQQQMQYAYTVCTEERGPGSYARMKMHMQNHVEAIKHSMFRQACDAVTTELEQMCKDIATVMQTLVDDLFDKVERDYLTVLVGRDAEALGSIPWAERMLRGALRENLNTADSWFAELFPKEEKDEDDDPFVPKAEASPDADEELNAGRGSFVDGDMDADGETDADGEMDDQVDGLHASAEAADTGSFGTADDAGESSFQSDGSIRHDDSDNMDANDLIASQLEAEASHGLL